MNCVEVRVDNFDIKYINIKKSDDNKFIVEYNKRPWNLICENKFSTYGLKNTFNIDKVTIIFDFNNDYHNQYKSVINKIYNKVKDTLKDKYKHIEVINPLGEKQNTLDIELYNFKNNTSRIFEVYNKNVKLIHVSEINRQFTICPNIFLYALSLRNNKLYFNYVIKEAYIKFEKPKLVSIEYILNIFDSDNEDDQEDTILDTDNEYLC